MNNPNLNGEDHDHVTAVISHLIRTGREEGYEEWIKGIGPVAKTFIGHLGVNIIRPQQGVRQEYVIVLCFDKKENLQTWLNSEERSEWMERAKPLIQEQEDVQVMTGLETWYDLPKRTQKSPPKRYKMMLTTWLGVFLTLVIVKSILVLIPFFLPLPDLLKSLILTGIVVWILTYFLMPQLTRLLAKWLYSKS
ncbi:MAG: antibiotic biosynthesis monooxygenase [Nostocales cyanobacterium ELA583]|jgi:antibiotic biosynthesis monooxygenase (ABM) superfamily enzyme